MRLVRMIFVAFTLASVAGCGASSPPAEGPPEPYKLGMFRHVGSATDDTVAPRFMAAPGRLKHGLVVYQGGRQD